jgi:aminoglycoside phosphotransferase family enzyme/predicted kinase
MDRTYWQELEALGFASIQTHISRVFLRDRDVYKCKRAVSLGFLDFSTLELRARACAAEVVLNRRLAPDVYLGVVGLVRDEHGTLCFVPEPRAGEVLEWAVHMRRLPDEARADTLLNRGQLSPHDVEVLARQIAAFHRTARADEETARLGGYEALAQNVHENFVQLAEQEAHVAADELGPLRAYQLAFLDRERSRLQERASAGFVRDGHGDLRLEHCYRAEDGRFSIIDCIEFNQRFRYADVCADLSFLTMDLRHLGRADLAERLVAAYARESGDYALYRLLDFYESYRAVVRGKVMGMLAQDAEVDYAVRARARAESRRYLLQARAAAARPLCVPRLYVTFGLIASGKSTLARLLCAQEGLSLLSADEVRKQLLGVAPTAARAEKPFVGAYGEQMTDRVYDEMFARASHVLASGRGVVLDASFRTQTHRARARALAKKHGVDVLFLECHVDRSSALARLAERARGPHVSDGRAEIYDAFAEHFESPDELSSQELVRVETNDAPERVLARALGGREPARRVSVGGRS